ncbi:MAG: hypothetical protein IH897_03690, partial [Planctomycetes bacterium]|nr:hypothetical protein [Planctomycetota bacterium]
MLLSRDTDGITGAELWRSDGTEAGTVMVKDINPGAGNTSFAALTNVNWSVFFRAGPVDTHNAELWNSDGTEAGTLMVRDINPAGASFPRSFLNVNGTLFFAANDGTDGEELWMSDGTAAGTMMVVDINPGPGGSQPGGLTNVNGTLFFYADDGTNGSHLWALAISTDRNGDGFDDAEDIANCAPSDPACIDNNGNGIPDECDVHTLLPATAPHDRKKNRYLSVTPNNAGIAIALRVILTASLNHPGTLGTFMWVGEPNADGVARLTSTPVTRLWPESMIQVTG